MAGNEALRFGEVRDFPLADLPELPGGADEEAGGFDIEGLAVDRRRLLLGLRGAVRGARLAGAARNRD